MADPFYEAGYPALHDAANETSMRSQRRFLVALRVRLIGIVTAAVGGAFLLGSAAHSPGALLILLGFTVALATELYVSLAKPDREWYEGRAAAESAKTLAWRYAVGGESFEMTSTDPDGRFTTAVRGLLRDLREIDLGDARSSQQITQAMRDARAGSFGDRRRLYASGRIGDQHEWYSKNAASNRKQKHIWLVTSLVLQFCGVIGGALVLADVYQFDAVGVLAAAAAAATSWAQAKQYSNLATAYGITAQELATILSEVDYKSEDDWAVFVGQAEEAISREHTLWRASRGVRNP